jgi:hypothetical protein
MLMVLNKLSRENMVRPQCVVVVVKHLNVLTSVENMVLNKLST